MKTLVVFYSLSGKTRLVAQTIAKEMQADLDEIEEVTARKNGPFAFLNAGMDARKGKTSGIKPLKSDITKYERVFIGSPLWGSRCAPAVNSFVDSTDLKDKELLLFFTMGGTNHETAVKFLTERIEKHAGKVVGSFSIATAKASDADITAKTREAVASYRQQTTPLYHRDISTS